MGRDKALIEVDGQPLAMRVADALTQAGAVDVRAVGGDAGALGRLGLTTVPDRWPGAGPSGGIITALGAMTAEVVLVAACDLVEPSPETLAATAAALATPAVLATAAEAEACGAGAGVARADVAAPVLDGRRRWDQAAWHRRALPGLTAQFEAGERAIHRAVAGAGLVVVEVAGMDRASLADADAPADLPPA
jgi:molybdenum cofactor guanylyltransferase